MILDMRDLKTTTDHAEAKRFATQKSADDASCLVMDEPGFEHLVCYKPHPTAKTGWCVTGMKDGVAHYLADV